MKFTTCVRAFLLLLSLIGFLNLKAQNTVTIGTGVSSTYGAPLYISSATSSNRYSQCAMLFTSQEIGATGNITKLSWNKANSEGYTGGNASLNVYVKKTSDVVIPTAGGTFANALQGATLVYSSSVQDLPQQTGWFDIPLNAPFSYDGSQNLMILVDWYRPGNATGPVKWYHTYNLDKSVTWAGSGPSPGSYYNNGSRPNTRLTFYDDLKRDAGVSAIQLPQDPIPPGSNPIVISMKNYGTDTLVSAQVNWSINGVVQTPFPWAGALAPSAIDTSVLIGTNVFTPGSYVLKAWSSLPNTVPDSNNSNDTATAVLTCVQSMSGSYTIGGAGSDFQDIGSAVSQLVTSGISGAVEFLLQPGVYNEQIDLGPVPGAAPQHRIVFRSATSNPEDVIIQHNANSAAENYTFRLNNASFVTLSDMTLRSVDSVYAQVIELKAGADHNIIQGNIIECQPEAKASYQSAGVYSGNTADQFNIISGNTIRNGYRGIYLFGPGSSSPEAGNVIEENIIEGSYYYGIYCHYQDAPQIFHNKVTSYPSPVYSFSISLKYISGQYQLIGNQVHDLGTGTSYGIRIQYSNGTASQPGLVNNNVIVQESASVNQGFGLYLENCSYQRVLHNTVVLKGMSGNSRCVQFKNGNNLDNVNNIYTNTGNGFAIVLNNNPLGQSNYNVYWTSGTIMALSQGSVLNNLSAWQNAISKDYNSVQLDPQFIPGQALLPTNPLVNNTGIPVPEVLFDILGEPRNPLSPDAGAYEFSLFGADAGITEIIQPGLVSNPGIQNASVRFRNYGTDTLTQLTLNVQVGSATPIQHSWTGNLAPQTEGPQLTVGTINLAWNNSVIKAWTSSPNGMPDSNAINDTLTSAVKVCNMLSGIYSIGDTLGGADFASFNQAVLAMESCGIDGDVVFEVEPGYYYEQVTVPAIYRSDTGYSITFQSETLNPDDVVLAYKPTDPTGNWVIQFIDASKIVFRNITIEVETGALCGKCVVLNGSKDITLDQNILIVPQVSSADFTVISSDNTSDDHIMITSNTLRGGHTGICFTGPSSGEPEMGNVFTDNVIEDFLQFGIQLKFQSNCLVSQNHLTSATGFNSKGISIYGLSSAFDLIGNRIFLPGAEMNVGFEFRYSAADSANRALVANNFVTLESGTDSSACGLSITALENTDFFHNTLYVPTPTGPIRFGSFCKSLRLLNNIFYNPGNGSAFFTNSLSNLSTGLDMLDYNCYFSNGPVLIDAGATYPNLTLWQSATNADINSLNIDPLFVSPVQLYPSDTALNGAGIGLFEVGFDIDSLVRDPLYPDPGAVEFLPRYNDAGIAELVSPLSPGIPSNQTISVKIVNTGLNPLQTCVIHYKVDSLPVQSYSWTGNLATFAVSQVIPLGSHLFPQGQSSVKVWTSLPNNGPDEYPLNDTIIEELVFCNPLSGHYTVGHVGSGSDYTSLGQAIDHLMLCGVDDIVYLDILPGTYHEQVSIGSIPGASQSHPVIIGSATGNPADVELQYAPVEIASNYVIQLDGANHIHIRDLSISIDSLANLGRAVVLRNNAAHNHILNNIIHIPRVQSVHFAGIYSGGGLEDYTEIAGNKIFGGMYGICWSGQSSSIRESNCVIDDNLISDFLTDGIQLNYQVSINVSGNTLLSNSASADCYGIKLTAVKSPGITGNLVELSGSGNKIALSINQSSGYDTAFAVIANNILSAGTSSGGNGAALSVSSSLHLEVVFNTLIVSNSVDLSAFQLTGSPANLHFLNNLLAHLSGGYSLKMDDVSAIGALTSCDYNNYHTSGNSLFYPGTPVNKLSQWQAIGNHDWNSFAVDPLLGAGGPYNPASIVLNNQGLSIPGIGIDYYGVQRHLTQPDIGAVEFDAYNREAALISAVVLGGYCDLGQENIEIAVVNQGQEVILQDSLGWSFQKSGSPVVYSGLYQDSISAGDTVIFVLPDQVDLSTSSDTSLRLKVWIEVPGDYDHRNDTIVKRFASLVTPAKPLVTDDTVQYLNSLVIAVDNPSPELMYLWYKDTLEQAFAMGPQALVQPGFNDTVFYVRASGYHQEHFVVGPADPTSAPFAGSFDPNLFLQFDVLEPNGVYLDSLDVYPLVGAGKPYRIIIKSDTGTIFMYDGNTSVPMFNRERIGLGVHIPYGTGYQIGLEINPGLLRNTSGANYPYVIPQVFQLTGNTGSLTQYPWFYNIQFRTVYQGCESGAAVDSVYVVLPPLSGNPGFDTLLCPNDTILLAAVAVGGIPPYSYSWSPVNALSSPYTSQTLAYPSDSTVFICTISDLAGQQHLVYFILNTFPVPDVQLDLGIDSIDVDQPPFMLTGGSPGGGTYSGNGVSGGYFDPSLAGQGVHVILYTIEDAITSCRVRAADTILVGDWIGLPERGDMAFEVYPNPSTGVFKLIIPANRGLYTLSLTDVSGQIIERRAIDYNTRILDWSDLPSGVYYLVISSKEVVKVKKLVILDH